MPTELEMGRMENQHPYILLLLEVIWSHGESRTQKVVARSSAEIELCGMVHGVCELLWIKRILRDLGIGLTNPIKLSCDNQAVVKIENNPVHHDRTKHVAVDRHFIKDHLEKGTIELLLVPSKDQLIDILTKAVCGRVFHSSLDM